MLSFFLARQPQKVNDCLTYTFLVTDAEMVLFTRPEILNDQTSRCLTVKSLLLRRQIIKLLEKNKIQGEIKEKMHLNPFSLWQKIIANSPMVKITKEIRKYMKTTVHF